MEQAKYDVFISYSRKDYVDEQKNVIPGNEVSKIKAALTEAGITYWFDEDGIYSGQNFVEKIVTNIENAKIFLFLSTANANKSIWTCKEVACADEFKKHIIPVRIDTTPYNKKVLFRIADLDYIDYHANPQNGMEDMIKSINAYLNELANAERLKKEEENKRKEQERKKAEEQKQVREIEARKHQEEQKKLTDDILASASELNIEEEKLSLERTKLIIKLKKITDREQRESLRTKILDSSPIRKKAMTETAQLQERIMELESIAQQQASQAKEMEKLRNELTDKDAEIMSLRTTNAEMQKESILKQSTQKQEYQTPKPDIRIHTIYGSIIIAILVLMRSCGYEETYTTVNSTDTPACVSTSHESPLDSSLSVIIGQLNNIHPQLQKCIEGYKQNDPKSTYQLAKYFENGDFLEGKRNLKIAGMLYHQAANVGLPEAQTSLGFYFYHGRGGLAQNYDSATFWYKEAIENGSHDAEYYLATAYGTGTYSKNDSTLRTKDAIELYKNSAEGGNAKSQIALGFYYYDNTSNYDDAKKWLTNGLNGDIPSNLKAKAQFYMGQLYGTGRLTGKKNDHEAFYWYKKSASTGDGYLEAIYYLGIYYENGRGTHSDIKKAIECYEKASQKGHKPAQAKLKKLQTIAKEQ